MDSTESNQPIASQAGRKVPEDKNDEFELFSYYYLTDDEAWAVGTSGGSLGSFDIALYKTTDKGETWEKIYDCDDFATEGDSLNFQSTGIFFFDAQNGVNVGKKANIPYYYMYTTNDGGLTWRDHLSAAAKGHSFLPLKEFRDEAAMNETIEALTMRPIHQSAVEISLTYTQNDHVYIKKATYDKTGLSDIILEIHC
jgi:hypothetical protein